MINTFTGPMHSGKSDALISLYKRIYRKDLIMAFKPSCDKRDEDEIKSKNHGETIPAIFIDDLSEIKEHLRGKNIHTVFIDEIEMLTGDVTELVDLSVICGIDFYVAGLNLTGEQQPFGIMGDVLAASDRITVVTGFCEECNKEAFYSFYKGDSMSSQIEIGDNHYSTLCPNCLREKLIKKHPEKMRILK